MNLRKLFIPTHRFLGVLWLIAMLVGARVSEGAGLATYQFGPGATTFGIALPQGAAPNGIQVGVLQTQTDVKTRWPDGSIRFAVISATIPNAGPYDITAANASVGAFQPAWPDIAVDLVIGGQTWTASAGAFNAADSWLSGPVLREARIKTVPRLGSTPHPQLEVVFDIRSYAAGGHRIDMTVQNVRDASTMDKVPASSVVLKVNGNPVWTHGSVTTYSMTRWRHVEWYGATEAAIVPDFEPTYLAGALPRVLTDVVNRSYDLSAPNYDVMGGPSGYPAIAYGEMNPDMAAGGGRSEIGALNWWEATYLAWKTPNQRQTVLRNADLTGAWSNHLAKPDGTFIKIGDPGYGTGWWWDTRSSPGNRPLATADAYTFRGTRDPLDATSDTGAVGIISRYNEEHVPAPMYVAYLISGDRYYVDQAKFWATRAILNTLPGWSEPDPVNFPGWKRGRDGQTGNERILDFSGMSREFGWPVRLLGYTAWMIPDSDSDKPYFMTTVQNNLNHAGQYFDLFVRLGYGGALGSLAFENPSATLTRNGQATGRFWSQWRSTYTAYSVDWCTRQGLWTITPSTDAFVNRLVNLDILLNLQNPDFLKGKSGLSHNYYPVFNTMSNGVINKWFDTFAELKNYNENYPYVDGPDLGNVGKWDPNMAETGYYDTEHWVALQIALRRGIPNADVALSRLIAVTGVPGDIRSRAGYAIVFSPQPPAALPDITQPTAPSSSSIYPPAAPSNVKIVR